MVVLLAAFALAQGQAGLFQKVVASPTGQNGYEEYVRAAEMVDGPEARALLEGLIRPNEQFDSSPHDVTRRKLVGMTRLDIERIVWEKYGGAISVAARGNLKPVFNPRQQIGVATTFPEFAGLKQVGRLAVAGAHVLYAEGSPRAATSVLLTALDMSTKIQEQSIISLLVGMAIRAMVLAAINENMGRLCEADWLAVDKAAANLLASPSAVAAALDGELSFATSGLDVLQDGKALDDSGDHELSDLTKNYSKEQWAALRQTVLITIKRQQEMLLATMRGEERNWSLDLVESDDPVVKALVSSLSPAYAGMLEVSARSNTQLRLLRLHAQIQTFRWRTGKLPDKLADVVESCRDPLSGEEFVYEPSVQGIYQLYSKGSPSSGRIDLKYARMKGGGGSDELTP